MKMLKEGLLKKEQVVETTCESHEKTSIRQLIRSGDAAL
jgi:hypothetical protein